MNVNLFKTDETYQLHSLKMGGEGYIVYSNFDNPKDLVFLKLDIWCFHFSEVKHDIEFPVKLDSIRMTKMRCNDGYLIVLKSKELLLKINISELPSIVEQPFKFQQGIFLASRVPTDTLLSEVELALDWLLLSKENSQLPLPGLPAIQVLSDSLLHYLIQFSNTPATFGFTRLTTLISRYMDYDISEVMYLFELKKLKPVVNR